MATRILMPKLGLTMTEGMILLTSMEMEIQMTVTLMMTETVLPMDPTNAKILHWVQKLMRLVAH